MNRATAALACLLLTLAAPALAAPIRARIDGGPLVGSSTGSVAVFKGVPYAAPPVGPLRWRPPAPPAPWKTDLQALDDGPSCPQATLPLSVSASSLAASTDEDCLTLNLWAPLNSQRSPVLVWIHGGGNTAGTGAQTVSDGTAFARDGVLVVSFNYRLGLLGFFAHPALAAEGQGADFGLMDQIAALGWVKRNIRLFGGDPDNVTVMGGSTGGQDVMALLAAPAAQGLFAKVILASPTGGWTPDPTLAAARDRAAKLTASLGAATAEDLRRLSARQLVSALGEGDAAPILDGVTLAQQPLELVATGRAPAIPLLIGSNSDEGFDLPAGGTADDRLSAKRAFRDLGFSAPARWIAAHWPAPAFLYRFDYVADAKTTLQPDGAPHSSEVPFVFRAPGGLTAHDNRVAEMVGGCWSAFVKTGAPTCQGAPAWPVYRASDDRLMRLADPPEVAPVPNAATLDAMAARLAPSTGR